MKGGLYRDKLAALIGLRKLISNEATNGINASILSDTPFLCVYYIILLYTHTHTYIYSPFFFFTDIHKL